MEETDKVISEAIKKGLEIAEKTGEFVIDQAPALIQEFYRWKLVSTSSALILSILIMLFCVYITNKFKESDISEVSLLWFIFGIIGAIISFFVVLVNAHALLFIIFAPKLYLIEYFLK
jgi:hypothetical protein